MVNTPVLFITFARPEYASQSFAAIKKAQPRKLYFYSNKAREDRPDEIKRNEQVRSYLTQIDWDCEVKTWFRDDYVDVFTSIWGAIDWVFDNEKEAIVIEEDVVTCPAFYEYMDTLVARYRNEKKVWIISGDNATPQFNPSDLSYFPTRYADIYGWASWADRWHTLDREMSKWPSLKKSKEFKSYYGGFLPQILQRAYFDQVYKKRPAYNPWDFIFNYNMALHRAYCLMPFVNLVADIGVSGANHEAQEKSPISEIRIETENFPFEKGAPINIEPTSFDSKFYIHNRFLGLVKRKLKKYLNI